MADQGHLMLHYRGGDADKGEIDYYMAAKSMMAFGDLMQVMSRATLGDKVKVETKLRGISPTGSILFEYAVYLGSIAQTAFTPATPDAMWNILKESISVWKFLKGNPPYKTEHHPDGIKVTNTGGDVIIINGDISAVINNPKAGDSAEELIKKPMEQFGIEEVHIEYAEHKDKNDKIVIRHQEREYFRDISSDRKQIEAIVERALYIESIKFREGNKWGFHDGESRLNAAIEDKEFLARINAGEAFSKGDVLIVDLYSVQRVREGKIVTEHRIVKVKDHQTKPDQFSIN